MGVLACDRNGCGNIMCGRFSYELQMYICNECFEELVETGATTDIESFMNSSKKELLILELEKDMKQCFL